MGSCCCTFILPAAGPAKELELPPGAIIYDTSDINFNRYVRQSGTDVAWEASGHIQGTQYTVYGQPDVSMVWRNIPPEWETELPKATVAGTIPGQVTATGAYLVYGLAELIQTLKAKYGDLSRPHALDHDDHLSLTVVDAFGKEVDLNGTTLTVTRQGVSNMPQLVLFPTGGSPDGLSAVSIAFAPHTIEFTQTDAQAVMAYTNDGKADVYLLPPGFTLEDQSGGGSPGGGGGSGSGSGGDSSGGSGGSGGSSGGGSSGGGSSGGGSSGSDVQPPPPPPPPPPANNQPPTVGQFPGGVEAQDAGTIERVEPIAGVVVDHQNAALAAAGTFSSYGSSNLSYGHDRMTRYNVQADKVKVSFEFEGMADPEGWKRNTPHSGDTGFKSTEGEYHILRDVIGGDLYEFLTDVAPRVWSESPADLTELKDALPTDGNRTFSVSVFGKDHRVMPVGQFAEMRFKPTGTIRMKLELRENVADEGKPRSMTISFPVYDVAARIDPNANISKATKLRVFRYLTTAAKADFDLDMLPAVPDGPKPGQGSGSSQPPGNDGGGATGPEQPPGGQGSTEPAPDAAGYPTGTNERYGAAAVAPELMNFMVVSDEGPTQVASMGSDVRKLNMTSYKMPLDKVKVSVRYEGTHDDAGWNAAKPHGNGLYTGAPTSGRGLFERADEYLTIKDVVWGQLGAFYAYNAPNMWSEFSPPIDTTVPAAADSNMLDDIGVSVFEKSPEVLAWGNDGIVRFKRTGTVHFTFHLNEGEDAGGKPQTTTVQLPVYDVAVRVAPGYTGTAPITLDVFSAVNGPISIYKQTAADTSGPAPEQVWGSNIPAPETTPWLAYRALNSPLISYGDQMGENTVSINERVHSISVNSGSSNLDIHFEFTNEPGQNLAGKHDLQYGKAPSVQGQVFGGSVTVHSVVGGSYDQLVKALRDLGGGSGQLDLTEKRTLPFRAVPVKIIRKEPVTLKVGGGTFAFTRTGTITAHIRPQGVEEGHAEYRKLAFPVYDVVVQLPENMSSSDAFYFGNPLAIGPHYGMMTNAAIEVIKDE